MNPPLNNRISIAQGILKVCGTRGTRAVTGSNYKVFGTNTSCYALNFGDCGLIVDCGTGFANALEFLKDCKTVDILLTHFHLDHISGLLSYPLLAEGGRKFKIYGHAENGTLQSTLGEIFRPPFWPVSVDTLDLAFVDIEADKDYKLFEGLTVETINSNHPNGCLLYNIKYHNKKLSFIFDYEYQGDSAAVKAFAHDADLLFFDGTFDEQEYEKYEGWGHSTWQGGVQFAKEVNAKKLLIVHHSPSRDDKALTLFEDYAKETLSNCEFAREGKEYHL